MSPLKKPFDCGGDPDWDSVSYKNLARPAALAEFRSLLLLVMNYRSLTLDIKPNIQDSLFVTVLFASVTMLFLLNGDFSRSFLNQDI